MPLCIYNNKKGADAKTLAMFTESAWNNPVVRFIGADGKDLIERKEGIYDTAGLLERMNAALAKAPKPAAPTDTKK